MPGAVLYSRVSTAEQAKQQYNIPAQIQKLKDYCQRESLTVLKSFTDSASGRTAEDRPEFQKMLAYCRDHRGKVSHVIVADLSRLARNVTDQGITLASLEQLGITLVSVDEPITDDTAAGKLARNMLGAFAQFFSDSLSERVTYRMKVNREAGRFLHLAPIGYLNHNKELIVDPERALLVRKAFELMREYPSGDSVLKAITALGLKTRRGKPLTKQTFSRMMTNPLYAGWIVSGKDRIRGKYEPLISDELFEAVQERLKGKRSPNKAVSEDFPLRGVVLCAKCRKPLTSGWVKGRSKLYPRYWCWQQGCGAGGVSKEQLEKDWVTLLGMMEPTRELLEKLPRIAACQWSTRKGRIAKDAEMLSKRLAEQETLNQKAIRAKLDGELSADDFNALKANIWIETEKIQQQMFELDREKEMLQDLMQQAEVQLMDLVKAWNTGTANQRQELAKGLFPEGLAYSHEFRFFEPSNQVLRDMSLRWLEAFRRGEIVVLDVGAGDGI